jgi:hypothetical protein
MTVVGFSLLKIAAERKGNGRSKLNIGNNITITNVTESEISLGANKETALVCSFEFETKYEPAIGNIVINGEVIYLIDAKKEKEVLAKWKKDKKLEDAITMDVLNHALNKCNIEALLISRDLNLPSPVPLPKISLKKDK